ncbi:50S ribosomal protein L15 [Candidatus Daviesbacteria bacterium]|nr:50S ribosomal protein L15 [Candidatus Daviesbacteria bacterium]
MQLSRLPQIGPKKKSKSRLGQGLSTGHGKTAGRGTKGQKAHSSVPFGFETGSRTGRLLKRLPFKKGIGNDVLGKKFLAINLGQLSKLNKNDTVDALLLIEKGLVKAGAIRRRGVKILSGGDFNIPLTFKLPVSQKARQKIEQAGGQVIWPNKTNKTENTTEDSD